jgi:2-polyprenyl-3-methyl-5-hydroxy-6-metoxy-1,4-benzoquinol methylase
MGMKLHTPTMDLPQGDALRELVARQLHCEPTVEPFLRKRFARVEPLEALLLERLARIILSLSGREVTQYCLDYGWLTRMALDEELYFRRHGRYRLETLDQAIEQVYSQSEVMTRYMNGLLMSQLWWSNHTRAILFYEQEFLASATGRCLEIGPGHGLLICLATRSGFDRVEAIDVSEASLAMTRATLQRAGGSSMRFIGHIGDLLDASAATRFHDSFDGIVFSEVLEHLDRPADAMRTLFAIARPGGRVFLNVPVNSPAPDHLFLLRSPDEARQFVGGFGFDVLAADFFPGANMSLKRAIETQSTISCVFLLQKPAAHAHTQRDEAARQ